MGHLWFLGPGRKNKQQQLRNTGVLLFAQDDMILWKEEREQATTKQKPNNGKSKEQTTARARRWSCTFPLIAIKLR